MKINILALLFVLFVNIAFTQTYKTLHDFKSTTLDGQPFDFSTLKGKKVIIVNTASKCRYTPQYAELEKLYKEYGGDKFTIIGFPANNFMKQEPGTNGEINDFCQKNYGVSFQMMSKISVKGKDIDPIYKWLTSKSENGVSDYKIKWNFQKFMIDENGKIVDVLDPSESPLSEKVINWINSK